MFHIILNANLSGVRVWHNSNSTNLTCTISQAGYLLSHSQGPALISLTTPSPCSLGRCDLQNVVLRKLEFPPSLGIHSWPDLSPFLYLVIMTLSTINQDGKTAFDVTITFVTLATIATGLRLLSRNVIQTRYEADDWLILAALIVSFVVGGLEIWGEWKREIPASLTFLTDYRYYCRGRGPERKCAYHELSWDSGILEGKAWCSPNIVGYLWLSGTYLTLKAEFITAPFYFTCLTFVRLSITSLYRRLFAVPKFRQTAFVTDGFTAVYWIICVFVNIFACTPINFLWNPEEKGSCVSGNFNKFTIASETFGIILDSCILALPVRMVMTLQMAMRNKIALCGIFLLGSL